MVVKKRKTLAERGITQRCAKLYCTDKEWRRLRNKRERLDVPWFLALAVGLNMIEAEQNAVKNGVEL